MAAIRALTVKQLNLYIKTMLESDRNLKSVTVNGEISNFNRNFRSGHIYFTLKDSEAAVKVVMFSSYASRLRFEPKDGMKVFIIGSVSLYERDGAYQIYCERMVPDGLGPVSYTHLDIIERQKEEYGINDLDKNVPESAKKSAEDYGNLKLENAENLLDAKRCV